jgi:hypothetical protein
MKTLCWLLFLLPLAVSAQNSPAPPQPYIYKATLVQAAPGKLLALIDHYKSRPVTRDEPAPLWMRHSQGDHWDLLLLYAAGRYQDYFSPSRVAARARNADWESRRKTLVTWEEDVFVFGPPLADVQKAFAGSGFFHVEMFHALAGQTAALIREREMENAYARGIQQPENFIFVRDSGAAWDVFTIGCFRDLKHYAQSSDVPRETAAQAARAAGFSSPDAIGPYLRELIADHHDTLAVAIK